MSQTKNGFFDGSTALLIIIMMSRDSYARWDYSYHHLLRTTRRTSFFQCRFDSGDKVTKLPTLFNRPILRGSKANNKDEWSDLWPISVASLVVTRTTGAIIFYFLR